MNWELDGWTFPLSSVRAHLRTNVENKTGIVAAMSEKGKKEEQSMGTILALEGQAYSLEKEGKLDEAKRLYWQIINMGFTGSFPYERLRIIGAKKRTGRKRSKLAVHILMRISPILDTILRAEE